MSENKIKQILSSKVFLFAILLAVIWLGLVSVKSYYRKYQLDQEIARLKIEIGKTDQRNQEIANLIDYLGNPDFLEKEAKEKLNLKKEGESVIMVPEAAISEQEIATRPVATPEPETKKMSGIRENNLIKWWRYFFGH